MIRRLLPACALALAMFLGGVSSGSAANRLEQSFGSLDHSIVYDDGQQIILIPASGSGPVGLADLTPSPSAFKRPRYAGWQFTYYDNGYRLGDIFGHRQAITPPLARGEQVF
ncbi:MAG: hypothetical protein ACRDG4_20305, partial [Chloroflexota bacterium]